MKYLLVTENWPPEIGGIQNYLSHLVSNLPKDSVTVVAPSVKGAEPRLPGDGVSKVIRKRFHWSFIKPSWLPLFIAIYRLSKKEKPDVILCGKGLFEGLLAYYTKKYLHIPYIVFTYAMEIEQWSNTPRSHRKLKRALSAADHIVYINNETMKTLQKLGVKEEKMVKIPPGVNQRYLNNVSDQLINSTLNHYQIKQPYILTVARLIPRKGIDTLIEAFSNLDQTRFSETTLVIVGSGPEESSLKNQVDQNLIGTSVKFLKNVPDHHLPSLYKGAELFVLTPRNINGDFEGFGIVYIEAAAVGTPAIASSSGGVPEAVIHNQTGLLIKENDDASLTDSIGVLLSNNALKLSLGERAKQRAQDKFTWEAQTRKFMNLLYNLPKLK